MGDGMSNVYETNYPGTLNPWVADGTNDPDGDLADNLHESYSGTDPGNRDTNGDGLSDGWQIQYGSDPLMSTGGLVGFSFERVGCYDTDGDSRKVVVSNQVAYVADGTNGLVIVDVSSPASPVLLSTVCTTGFAYDVSVAGTRAFVAVDNSSAALYVVDVTSPGAPSVLGTAPGYAFSMYQRYGYYSVVALSETSVVVGSQNRIQRLDVSNPAAITVVGSQGNYSYGYVYGLDAEESRLYATAHSYFYPGNPVFNVSTGAFDVVGAVTNQRLFYGAYGVSAVDDTAYYACEYNGLHIFDVTNPGDAQWMGQYRVATDYGYYSYTAYPLEDVVVQSNLAYMAWHNYHLQVADVSDPANIVWAGECKTDAHAFGVYLDGGYIYVADERGGLQIIQQGGMLDSDQDGMLDSWEMAWFSNLAQTATGDYDGDGIWNIGEAHANLNPTVSDQDADGLNDGEEVSTYNSSPTMKDSDYDGLGDSNEVRGANGFVTKPYAWDTDGDGADDALEPTIGRDPTDPNDGGPVSTVGGVVRVAGGDVLADAKVRLFGSDHDAYRSGCTDSNGLYSMSYVQSGTYRVKVDADGYKSQWYNAQVSFDAADTYFVPTNAVITNLNFAMEAGQLPAYANVTAPTGAVIYLDYLDTGKTAPALITLGQAAMNPNEFKAASHTITLKQDGVPLAGVKSVGSEQADTVEVAFNEPVADDTGGGHH